MKKPNHILLAALVVVVIGAFAWVAFREPREPVYQGRKLSAWLEDHRHTNRLDVESFARYEDAVSSVDTNAIPFLLDLFKRPAFSPFRTRLVDWANRHSNLFHRYFLTEADRHSLELGMCENLGEKAKPILPDLLLILRKSNNAETKLAIVESLPYLTSDMNDVRPVLLNALKNGDSDMRFEAAFALARFGSDARGVIPLLVDYADGETNNWRKSHIREAIKRIEPDAASNAGVK